MPSHRTLFLRAIGALALLACGCEDDVRRSDVPPCDEGAMDIQLGQFHSCALLCNGSVRCWGENSFGQLGLGDRDARGDAPGEMGSALPEVNLGADRLARGLSLGNEHTCALLDGGAVKCWGANGSGELGLGDVHERGSEPNQMGDALPEVDLGDSAIAVSAGGSHTCALLEGGAIKCWGANYFGELGQGDNELRGDEPGELGEALASVALGAFAVEVVTGEDHSCALLEDGAVKCWGYNADGQLGLGDVANRGDAAGEMGRALPGVALDAPEGVRALAAHGGSHHSCALLRDGRLKCWGANVFGELGLGDRQARGDDRAELGDQLPNVDLGELGASAIAVGSSISCAILGDQSARCWGYNGYAALGLGDTRHRGDTADTLGKNLPALALGTGRHPIAIRASGGNHACALLDDRSVKCWGASSQGQLGQGHGDTIGDQSEEMGDALGTVDLSAPVASGPSPREPARP